MSERDDVLAAIAGDAARAGDAETTRTVVSKITAFSSRDEAIVNCARLLVAVGKRADALELAKLVTTFSTRGDLIKELAKRGHEFHEFKRMAAKAGRTVPCPPPIANAAFGLVATARTE